MKHRLRIVFAVCAALAITLAVVLRPPVFGTKPLFPADVDKITVKVRTVEMTVSDRDKCAAIIARLQKARGGGQLHECKSLASVRMYAGTNQTDVSIVPGHRSGRKDIFYAGKCYSLADSDVAAIFSLTGLDQL